MKPTVVATFFFAVLCPLGAQESTTSKVPPPKPPFIKRVTLPAAWTITFTRPAADEMVDVAALKKFLKETMGADSKILKNMDQLNEPIAKPMIRTLLCTRTTDFTKEEANFSDNTTQTTYIFSIARISKHVAYDGLIRSRRDHSVVTYSPDFTDADFTGFDWLNAENYKGVQSVMGRECYLFSDEVESEDSKLLNASGMKPAGAEAYKFTARAFIDIKTRLPVVLQRGEETRVFAMVQPAAADLVLPAEVTMEIRDWKAELTAATTAAPPP
jgi:hypothetical protein